MNKELAISFIKSFVGTFITFGLVALAALPEGTLLNPEFYQTGGFIALLGAAVRSALSETWKRVAPVSIGGVKKSRD